MIRKEAINIMAIEEEQKMSVEDKKIRLLSNWGLDESDEIFKFLSLELQMEMEKYSEPQHRVDSNLYKPLLIFSVEEDYRYLKNSWLSLLVSKVLNQKIVVEGKEIELYPCPCCGYRTLTERGEYYICPTCFWEDTGSDDEEIFSGPNHMTLREAKNNYRLYGAVTKTSLKFTIKNPEAKYYR